MTAGQTLYQVVRGEGPKLFLVHGSATDADGWITQFATLRHHFEMIAYDRRGTERSPLPTQSHWFSVEEHADDLAELIKSHSSEPVFICGSSFGGVVVLQTIRKYPELFRSAILMEPPLADSDTAPAVPEAFMQEFNRYESEFGGPAAGAFFLKTVLGEEAFAAMPKRWSERACDMYGQIRADSVALENYPPHYAQLSEVKTPILLLGGGRSAKHFGLTLRALEAALPRAERRTIEPAGHMMHADATRTFNAEVLRFARAQGVLPPAP